MIKILGASGGYGHSNKHATGVSPPHVIPKPNSFAAALHSDFSVIVSPPADEHDPVAISKYSNGGGIYGGVIVGTGPLPPLPQFEPSVVGS